MQILRYLVAIGIIAQAHVLHAQTWKTVSSPVLAGYYVLDIALHGQATAVMSTGSFNNVRVSGIDLYNRENGQWQRISPIQFQSENSEYSDLQYDDKGVLWVASGARGAGLLRYNRMQWQEFPVGDSLDTVREFRQIVIHPHTGHIWLAAESMIRDKQVSLNPPTWIGHGYTELFEYDGTGFRKILHEDSYGHSNRKIAVSQDGKYIWVVQTLSSLLLKINAETRMLEASYPLRFTGIPNNGSVPDDVSNCHLLVTSDERVWFSYSSVGITGPPFFIEGALTVFDPAAERWSVLDSNAYIMSMAHSSDNNIWLVKNAKLHKLDVSTGTINETLDLNTAFRPQNQNQYPNASVVVDDNGKLWLGSGSMGVAYSEQALSVEDEYGPHVTYPNPVTSGGALNIILPEAAQIDEYNFRLVNALGQSWELHASKINNHVKIEIPSELASGFYLITNSTLVTHSGIPVLIQGTE